MYSSGRVHPHALCRSWATCLGLRVASSPALPRASYHLVFCTFSIFVSRPLCPSHGSCYFDLRKRTGLHATLDSVSHRFACIRRPVCHIDLYASLYLASPRFACMPRFACYTDLCAIVIFMIPRFTFTSRFTCTPCSCSPRSSCYLDSCAHFDLCERLGLRVRINPYASVSVPDSCICLRDLYGIAFFHLL